VRKTSCGRCGRSLRGRRSTSRRDQLTGAGQLHLRRHTRSLTSAGMRRVFLGCRSGLVRLPSSSRWTTNTPGSSTNHRWMVSGENFHAVAISPTVNIWVPSLLGTLPSRCPRGFRPGVGLFEDAPGSFRHCRARGDRRRAGAGARRPDRVVIVGELVSRCPPT
jgi:hypothetical protein